MICHTPPYDTRLDRLMNGTPVGSPAVRAFIEERAPQVCVVGHIHEGRGVERVGDTLVLNAGALRDGGYVVVEDDGDQPARRAAQRARPDGLSRCRVRDPPPYHQRAAWAGRPLGHSQASHPACSTAPSDTRATRPISRSPCRTTRSPTDCPAVTGAGSSRGTRGSITS